MKRAKHISRFGLLISAGAQENTSLSSLPVMGGTSILVSSFF